MIPGWFKSEQTDFRQESNRRLKKPEVRNLKNSTWEQVPTFPLSPWRTGPQTPTVIEQRGEQESWLGMGCSYEKFFIFSNSLRTYTLYFDHIASPDSSQICPLHTRLHAVSFCLSPLSPLCVARILGVVSLPGVTLKKTDSSSPSNYQMPIIPQLGVGVHAHLPTSTEGFCRAWAWAGLKHANIIAGSSCVKLTYLENSFLVVVHHLWLLQFFHLLLLKVPQASKEGLDIDIPFRAE